MKSGIIAINVIIIYVALPVNTIKDLLSITFIQHTTLNVIRALHYLINELGYGPGLYIYLSLSRDSEKNF